MSTRNSRSALNRQILDEASKWFVDFRAGDIDADARKEFHEWLRRSPEHIQAYLDIASTYAELPAPSPDGELDVQALIDNARSSTDANVIPLEVPGSGVTGISGLSPSAKTSTRRVLAIAASFLLAILALGSWFHVARDTYTTGIGEQRSLALADGSTVELNSRSRIRVRYTDDERRIDLIDGQALFQVAKNTHRPFIVHVNDTQVRAVGTQFDVYRKSKGTVVTVVEGTVSVDFAGSAEASNPGLGSEPSGLTERFSALGPANSGLVLSAGEQLTISPLTPDTKVTGTKVSGNVVVAAATAWTQRQLIFDNASLNEVAEEFNRYSTRPIIMETGDFDPFHISGTYSSTNPESLLRFLRVQPGIRLIESDGEIRITRE